jgi:hypothetical protein
MTRSKTAEELAEEVLANPEVSTLPLVLGGVLGGVGGAAIGTPLGGAATATIMAKEKEKYLSRRQRLLRSLGINPERRSRSLPPEIQERLLKLKKRLGVPNYGRGVILRGDSGKGARLLRGALLGGATGIGAGAGLGILGSYGLSKLLQD